MKFYFSPLCIGMLIVFIGTGCDKSEYKVPILDLTKNQVDILFVSETAGLQQIFAVQDTALNKVWNVTAAVGQWGVLDPAWSGNPRRYAFSSLQWVRSDYYPFVSNIYILNMDSASTVKKRITPITYDTLRIDSNHIYLEAINLRPDWSLNGSRIVYISNRTGRFEIYITAVSDSLTGDSIPKKLTDSTDKINIYCCPSFSPDGTKILYTSSSSGFEEIWMMDTSGANKIKLTNTGATITRRPRFSPSGDKIVFHSNLFINGDDSLHIFTINPNGSELDTVTMTGNAYDPYWSPDGLYIIYARKFSMKKGYIYMIHRNGSGEQRLINDSKAYYPAWRPSGSR